LGLAIIETLISVIGGFVSAVIAGIFIKRRLDHYFRPILVIDGNEAFTVSEFQLHSSGEKGHVSYFANRISIRNTGRSAAKDCKAYIDYGKNTQRAAWLIPDKNSGYTTTLNVQDKEFVDLCAISIDNLVRIIPAEQGYVNEFETEYATRLPPSAGEIEITLRITSSNAKPTERCMRLYSKFENFSKEPGRIVEFIK
jgi:hypothetical protein